LNWHLNQLIEKDEVQVEQLVSIPGVSYISSLVIISEIGADMSRFGNAKRLAAWAGVCPGNNESAGKRRSDKTPLGNKYLKITLDQISWAARKTNSFLGLKFRSLETRLGKKKAAVAIAHKIIIIIYNLLDQGTFYDEERNRRLQERSNERRLKYACNFLKQHGYQVEAKE
jgi:transposase